MSATNRMSKQAIEMRDEFATAAAQAGDLKAILNTPEAVGEFNALFEAMGRLVESVRETR